MARVTLEHFLTSFVLPLVRGGELHIGTPISVDDVNELDGEIPHQSALAEEVDDARHTVVSTLLARPPGIILERDDLALAAALHNALLLAHPDVDRFAVTQKQRQRIADTGMLLAAQPMTTDLRRVLSRHGLLHNIFAITRRDISLSWWSGRANFYGQAPPARLTTWRSVRRVHEDKSEASFDELISREGALPIAATLLRRSPLTQLLTTHISAPVAHWEDAAFLLRHIEFARAVAYIAVGDGDAAAASGHAARLAAGFDQMLERMPPVADVRAVAAFLVHLAALFAAAEQHLPSKETSPMVASALAATGEHRSTRPRGLSTLLALPTALAIVAPELAAPPGIDSEPQLARRWNVQRAQVAAGIGTPVIDALVDRLGRHLGSPAGLPPKNSAEPLNNADAMTHDNGGMR